MKYDTAFTYFPEDDIEYILYEFRKLLAGEGLLSMGKYVQEFEQQFANCIGVPRLASYFVNILIPYKKMRDKRTHHLQFLM